MFTLEDLGRHGRLVVGSGGEDLALAGGDDGVTRDQLGRDATGGLDTKSEGVDIDEDDITQALVTGKDTTLNGSTISNTSSGLMSLEGSFPKYSLRSCWTLGIRVKPPTRTTYNIRQLSLQRRIPKRTDLIDILLLEIGILENLLDRLHGLLNKYVFNSSNSALVNVSERSLPSSKDSISIPVDC